MRRLSLTIPLCAAVFLSLGPLAAQAPTVTQIAGSTHILVLLSDGTVSALGGNEFGQLARPKSTRTFEPASRVALPGKVVQVAASDQGTSYALLDDGTVWAWGQGFNNTLGVPLSGAREARNRHTPEQVPGLAGVARVVAQDAVAMAIMRDGSVRAWGLLPEALTGGQRVYPGVATPIVVNGLANVADLVLGVSSKTVSGYALTRDGRVYSWGGNVKGEMGTGGTSWEFQLPALVPGVRDVVSIATVNGAAVVVTRDGRVWSWGNNEQGGLGHGTQTDTVDPGQPTPAVVAGFTDAVEVKAGTMGREFIVRRRNNTLIGWGNSDWGQLGAGVSGRFQLNPTAIRLPDVDAYWLCGNYSFARTKDGTVWFWGDEVAAMGLLGVRGNQRIPARVPVAKLIP
jgi:alpha-tubulin suppressor-like RCC1 family protein